MNRVKGPARLGFFAALLALLIAPLAIGLQSANAQGVDRATYYGVTEVGASVGASIGGAACGEATTANDAGEWVINIAEDDCDGGAVEGATVNFSLNGAEAEQTEVWAVGDTPDDLLNGITLTVAAMPEPTAEATAEPTEEAVPTEEAMPAETPAMPDDVGNAGLVTSESSSPLMALALGILMVGGIAGARASTRRVS